LELLRELPPFAGFNPAVDRFQTFPLTGLFFEIGRD
jgi:hypothetical protein